jgi:hypothetical protein
MATLELGALSAADVKFTTAVFVPSEFVPAHQHKRYVPPAAVTGLSFQSMLAPLVNSFATVL